MNTRRKKESSLRYIARGVGAFGKDLALDAAGELLDLGMGTVASLTTLGLFTPQVGDFNPRRRKASTQQRQHRRRR